MLFILSNLENFEPNTYHQSLLNHTHNEDIQKFKNKSKHKYTLIKCIQSRIKVSSKSLPVLSTFITLNEKTIQKHFNISEDIMVLSNPKVIENQLCFDDQPYHTGKNFVLVKQTNEIIHKQSTNFNTDSDNASKRMILCHKTQFFNTVNQWKLGHNIVYVSLSDKDTKTQDIESKDSYVVLLIVVSKNSNTREFSDSRICLDENDISFLKKMKNPNVRSSDGKKHNRSFGKYYGFGLSNKYNCSDNGLTFGRFKRKTDRDNENMFHLEANMRRIFNNLASMLNETLPRSLTAGNSSIQSLIQFGRNKTINKHFKTETNPQSFGSMWNCYYSIWLCEDARTELFHQELDASYTMIAVPKFNSNVTQNSDMDYRFEFRWCPPTQEICKGIDIILKQDTCIYYSGLGLFHRQIPNSDVNNNQKRGGPRQKSS